MIIFMKEQKATNVVWHDHKVDRRKREQLLKQIYQADNI